MTRALIVMVIAFAAGVLSTGIAYDWRDYQAWQAKQIEQPSAPASRDARIMSLICVHKRVGGMAPDCGRA